MQRGSRRLLSLLLATTCCFGACGDPAADSAPRGGAAGKADLPIDEWLPDGVDPSYFCIRGRVASAVKVRTAATTTATQLGRFSAGDSLCLAPDREGRYALAGADYGQGALWYRVLYDGHPAFVAAGPASDPWVVRQGNDLVFMLQLDPDSELADGIAGRAPAMDYTFAPQRPYMHSDVTHHDVLEVISTTAGSQLRTLDWEARNAALVPLIHGALARVQAVQQHDPSYDPNLIFVVTGHSGGDSIWGYREGFGHYLSGHGKIWPSAPSAASYPDTGEVTPNLQHFADAFPALFARVRFLYLLGCTAGGRGFIRSWMRPFLDQPNSQLLGVAGFAGSGPAYASAAEFYFQTLDELQAFASAPTDAPHEVLAGLRGRSRVGGHSQGGWPSSCCNHSNWAFAVRRADLGADRPYFYYENYQPYFEEDLGSPEQLPQAEAAYEASRVHFDRFFDPRAQGAEYWQVPSETAVEAVEIGGASVPTPRAHYNRIGHLIGVAQDWGASWDIWGDEGLEKQRKVALRLTLFRTVKELWLNDRAPFPSWTRGYLYPGAYPADFEASNAAELAGWWSAWGTEIVAAYRTVGGEAAIGDAASLTEALAGLTRKQTLDFIAALQQTAGIAADPFTARLQRALWLLDPQEVLDTHL